MTQLIKRHSGQMFVAGFMAGVLALTVMAFNNNRSREANPREVVLLAKDIAFHVPDQPGKSNPTLVLNKGEPVRLTIRNDEPGAVLHCFTIGGLEVKTSRDLATGESETITFTPSRKGTFAYACLMHPMMTGKVIVE